MLTATSAYLPRRSWVGKVAPLRTQFDGIAQLPSRYWRGKGDGDDGIHGGILALDHFRSLTHEIVGNGGVDDHGVAA